MREIVFLLKVPVYAILGAMVCILLVVLYNPIVFGLWALIAPTSAAASLNKAHFEAVHRCTRFVYTKWMPWRTRRAFWLAKELKGAPTEVQLRFLDEEKISRLELVKSRWLISEVLDRVWRDELVPRNLLISNIKLTAEQFRMLIEKSLWPLVGQAIFEKTPREEILLELARAACKNEKACELLCRYAQDNELPASLVDMIYEQGSWSVQMALKNSVEMYAEKRMILSTTKNMSLWKECAAGGISAEHQSLMTLEQYRAYHKMGHSLSQEAQIEILSAGGRYAEEVLLDLLEDDESLCNQVETLIMSRSQYIKIMLEARAKSLVDNAPTL